jgi:C1A family cysteine protease
MSSRLPIAPSLFLLLVLSSTVLAQIDQAGIAAMQQQGVDEGWTFTVSENPATQYSINQLCGLVLPADWQSKARFDPIEATSGSVVPPSFDWRDYGGCTPIRDQGGCNSCWAFATVGALECAILIRDGVSVDLSEQWLISCNAAGFGCSGGGYAHSYFGLQADRCGGTGAVLETDFPYSATEGSCDCPYEHHYSIDDWAYIGSSTTPEVDDLKRAILEYGPISVSVHASGAFQGYDHGIFNYCGEGEINHMVVLVGWDDTQGTSGVWIMRNSWGRFWGENGYMRIAYNCALIGYAACYVDYRPITVSCNTEFGPAPLAVDFQYEAPGTTVSGLHWAFGDGATSTDFSPSHVYSDPGNYTVTLTLTTPGGELSKICYSLITVHDGGVAVDCCQGMVGDANMKGEEIPTIGDATTLIDHLFITGRDLECLEEADINQSGGVMPSYDDITIGDICILIDYLFITGPTLGLPACL